MWSGNETRVSLGEVECMDACVHTLVCTYVCVCVCVSVHVLVGIILALFAASSMQIRSTAEVWE